MSEPDDDFDPNDVLRGWAPGAAGQAGQPADMTHVLDGWLPGGATPAPVKRRWAEGDTIDLPHVDVVNTVDVTDLGGIGATAAAAARQQARAEADAASDVSYTEAPLVVRRHVNPRLLAQWQPGAWTGAMQRVCDATTEFLQTPQGPVIETYPPHWLLALWPPQNLSAPLLSRWPLRVMLRAADADRASDALLPLMPPAAMLWLTQDHVDWALLGDLVLHHDSGLRPVQITTLRAFVEAERLATYTRLNNAYELPAPGDAVRARER